MGKKKKGEKKEKRVMEAEADRSLSRRGKGKRSERGRSLLD